MNLCTYMHILSCIIPSPASTCSSPCPFKGINFFLHFSLPSLTPSPLISSPRARPCNGLYFLSCLFTSSHHFVSMYFPPHPFPFTSSLAPSPNHFPSTLTWKLMGGGGFFGSIRTTDDSTFGAGRKLFFPTCYDKRHIQHTHTYMWYREMDNILNHCPSLGTQMSYSFCVCIFGNDTLGPVFPSFPLHVT